MKTLIIDAQLWQTNAWYRGMGVYTRSLLAAYIAEVDDIQIHIVLNSNLPLAVDRRERIVSEFPSAKIHELKLPTNPSKTKAATTALDHFIESQDLAKDSDMAYIILSLFMFDFCASYPSYGKKILLNYDLIPLVHWDYFQRLFSPKLYFRRFQRIYEADLVLVISETTANDTMHYFGIAEDKIKNIDGAADQLHETVSAKKSDILRELGIKDKHFILMPTGGLPHKNALRAVEAFANLADVSSQDIKLVATSFYEEEERRELEIISKDLIFTGNITDADMGELYTNCRTVLMPSLYEGLGIPVLEAVTYNKPVACSNIAVFREIPHHLEALYMFDPYDVASIYDSLFKAVAHADFVVKQAYYPQILAKYNWARSAHLFADALNQLPPTTPTHHRLSKHTAIAVVCPDPRIVGDTGRIAQNLWGYGKVGGVDITYFIDSGDNAASEAKQPDYIRELANCYDISDYYQVNHDKKFQRTLYFLSDDPRFSHIMLAALQVPGVAYIAKRDYKKVIDAMGEQNFISPEQYAAEQFIVEHVPRDVCNALSVITGAQGLVIEVAYEEAIKEAQKITDKKVPSLVVELDEQGTDYEALLAFMTKE